MELNDDRQPATRKIQVTGGSTYTVSLPKEWASQQDIEPGNEVQLYPRDDHLLVSHGDYAERRREIEIDSDGREAEDLSRSVAAAYIAGCDEIRVEGVMDNRQRRGVRDAVAGLVGIEIHEEGDGYIVARTMLDVGDLSPEQTVVQMKLTALGMHEDAVSAVLHGDDDKARRIQRQDDDVDRLFGLICREFQRGLVDVGVDMHHDGLTKFEYYTTARQLERIGDHAERIATAAERTPGEPPEDLRSRIQEVSDEAREIVERAVEGVLEGKNAAELGSIVVDAETLTEETEELHRELYETDEVDGYHLGTVVDSITRTAEYGVNVAEAGLQVAMRSE
ncbi:MAG: PhoU domain-containing protein [Halobacteriales archaeon]